MPVLHTDFSILHMQLACLWLDAHFGGAIFIPFLKCLAFLLIRTICSSLVYVLPFYIFILLWKARINFLTNKEFFCSFAFWLYEKNYLVPSGRCTMKKRWTKQQHFCNFTWAAGNVAPFPHELKVVIGQVPHSHSTQLMPTSGADLSEDVAVGIVRMGQGRKCREWHNWCISVISKDSQCGCSQSFHPPLCEKEMVLNNKLHFYLQKTDWNK